jgi:hypothetical protein
MSFMKSFLFGSLISITGSVFGQNSDVIEFFNIDEYNGQVYLSWNIRQGYSCNGIKIEHSTDSVNFEEIGSIEGVCGSASASTEYDFTDNTPAQNQVNYYRLHLGGVGYSWVKQSLVIDLSKDNYMLAPNPIVESSILYFDNDAGDLSTLNIYNFFGELVSSTITFNDFFPFNQLILSEGNYLFTITMSNSSTVVRGKFAQAK